MVNEINETFHSQLECGFNFYTIKANSEFALALGKRSIEGHLLNLICFGYDGNIFTLEKVELSFVPPECIIRVVQINS